MTQAQKELKQLERTLDRLGKLRAFHDVHMELIAAATVLAAAWWHLQDLRDSEVYDELD